MTDFQHFQTDKISVLAKLGGVKRQFLVKYGMSFWRENSNVVEISPEKLIFNKISPLQRAGLTPDEVSELVKKTKEKKDLDQETDASGKKLYERRYRPAWEREFPFISKAPDGSEYAYCKLCRDYLAPKVNDIRKHMYTMKHRKRAIGENLFYFLLHSVENSAFFCH